MGMAELDSHRYLVVLKVRNPLMRPAENLDDAWRAAEDLGERHGHDLVGDPRFRSRDDPRARRLLNFGDSNQLGALAGNSTETAARSSSSPRSAS